jgi:hypothetical protein
MTVDLTAGVVRILKPNGATAGAGFVASDDGFIVTCAHVVRWHAGTDIAGLKLLEETPAWRPMAQRRASSEEVQAR